VVNAWLILKVTVSDAARQQVPVERVVAAALEEQVSGWTPRSRWRSVAVTDVSPARWTAFPRVSLRRTIDFWRW